MTIGQEPHVSIGMSLFNSERTLATAIRSILKQTYRNRGLILIDDGSTDEDTKHQGLPRAYG